MGVLFLILCIVLICIVVHCFVSYPVDCKYDSIVQRDVKECIDASRKDSEKIARYLVDKN